MFPKLRVAQAELLLLFKVTRNVVTLLPVRVGSNWSEEISCKCRFITARGLLMSCPAHDFPEASRQLAVDC